MPEHDPSLEFDIADVRMVERKDVLFLGHVDPIIHAYLLLWRDGQFTWEEVMQACVVELSRSRLTLQDKLITERSRNPSPVVIEPEVVISALAHRDKSKCTMSMTPRSPGRGIPMRVTEEGYVEPVLGDDHSQVVGWCQCPCECEGHFASDPQCDYHKEQHARAVAAGMPPSGRWA